MGACASKFGVLKGTTDAPPPEEVGSRDVKSEVPVDDESKRQLLGNLLKENEGKDSTLESGGKLSDVVKLEDGRKDTSLENETVKSSQPICDAPAKESLIPEESKTGDENLVKLSVETMEHKTALEKEAEEEQSGLPNFETTLMDKHEECKPALETGKDNGDGKPDDLDLVKARNLETPDCEKIEDKQPDSVVEKVMVEIPGVEETEQMKQAEKGDKESVEHPNTDRPIEDKCGDTSEVKTSL